MHFQCFAYPNIVAAEAALRQAHELTLAGAGAFYPTVQGGLGGNRNKNAATVTTRGMTARQPLATSRPAPAKMPIMAGHQSVVVVLRPGAAGLLFLPPSRR
jgi:hypothetical protein